MNFKKLISLATAACFLFSFVFAPAAQAVVELRQDGRDFRKMLDDFIIPHTAGRVTYARHFGSDKVVINIQDLHCHPEVQRNIAKILSILDEKYRLKKVFVEGAYGPVDTSWLADIKDQELKKEIVESLVDQGKLTGTEYFSIQSGRKDALYGLENETVYKDNLKRLNVILENQPRYAETITALEQDLDSMKRRYFNSKNKRFERMVSSYKAGKMDAAKYYRLLFRYAEKLNDHAYDIDSVASIRTGNYPNIVGYLQLLDSGKSLQYRTISRQLQEFVGILKQKLPYNAYNFLLAKTDNFQKLDELYVYLARIADEYQIDLVSAFPQLNVFFDYIEKSQNINPLQLVKEEKKLVEEIRTGLAADISELEVAFLVDFSSDFEEFLTNKLSAEDYDYFTYRFDKFKLLWKKYAEQTDLLAMESDFELLTKFYQVNLQRNNYFVENVIDGFVHPAPPAEKASGPQNLEKIVASLDSSQDVLVVVTGGFHTQGLEQILNDRHVSYLVVTPNVTRSTKESDIVYSEFAREQARVLSQSFALGPLAQCPLEIRIKALLAGEILVSPEAGKINLALLTIKANETPLDYIKRVFHKVASNVELDRETLENAAKKVCAICGGDYRIEEGKAGSKARFVVTFTDRDNRKVFRYECRANRQVTMPGVEEKTVGHKSGEIRVGYIDEFKAGSEKISVRFLVEGRDIFDPELIAAEKAKSEKQATVVWDIDDTIGLQDSLTGGKVGRPDVYNLRQGIKEQMKILRKNGVRLIIWSTASRKKVIQFFEDAHDPELASLFDLVITRENFVPSDEDEDSLEDLIQKYQDAGADDDFFARHGSCPKLVGAVFGQKALLVDDYTRVEELAAEGPGGTFKAFRINPLTEYSLENFVPGRQRDQEFVDSAHAYDNSIASMILKELGIEPRADLSEDQRSSTFAHNKVICWDVDGTLLNNSGDGDIEVREDLPKTLESLEKRKAENVITTSRQDVGSAFDEEISGQGIGKYFGQRYYSNNDNEFRGKKYAEVARQRGLNAASARDHLIVVGDGPADRPTDLDGVVFVKSYMYIPAGAVEAVIDLLNEQGNGSFHDGFMSLYNKAEEYRAGSSERTIKIEGMELSLEFLKRETSVGRVDEKDNFATPAITILDAETNSEGGNASLTLPATEQAYFAKHPLLGLFQNVPLLGWLIKYLASVTFAPTEEMQAVKDALAPVMQWLETLTDASAVLASGKALEKFRQDESIDKKAFDRFIARHGSKNPSRLEQGMIFIAKAIFEASGSVKAENRANIRAHRAWNRTRPWARLTFSEQAAVIDRAKALQEYLRSLQNQTTKHDKTLQVIRAFVQGDPRLVGTALNYDLLLDVRELSYLQRFMAKEPDDRNLAAYVPADQPEFREIVRDLLKAISAAGKEATPAVIDEKARARELLKRYELELKNGTPVRYGTGDFDTSMITFNELVRGIDAGVIVADVRGRDFQFAEGKTKKDIPSEDGPAYQPYAYFDPALKRNIEISQEQNALYLRYAAARARGNKDEYSRLAAELAGTAPVQAGQTLQVIDGVSLPKGSIITVKRVHFKQTVEGRFKFFYLFEIPSGKEIYELPGDIRVQLISAEDVRQQKLEAFAEKVTARIAEIAWYLEKGYEVDPERAQETIHAIENAEFNLAEVQALRQKAEEQLQIVQIVSEARKILKEADDEISNIYFEAGRLSSLRNPFDAQQRLSQYQERARILEQDTLPRVRREVAALTRGSAAGEAAVRVLMNKTEGNLPEMRDKLRETRLVVEEHCELLRPGNGEIRRTKELLDAFEADQEIDLANDRAGNLARRITPEDWAAVEDILDLLKESIDRRKDPGYDRTVYVSRLLDRIKSWQSLTPEIKARLFAHLIVSRLWITVRDVVDVLNQTVSSETDPVLQRALVRNINAAAGQFTRAGAEKAVGRSSEWLRNFFGVYHHIYYLSPESIVSQGKQGLVLFGKLRSYIPVIWRGKQRRASFVETIYTNQQGGFKAHSNDNEVIILDNFEGMEKELIAIHEFQHLADVAEFERLGIPVSSAELEYLAYLKTLVKVGQFMEEDFARGTQSGAGKEWFQKLFGGEDYFQHYIDLEGDPDSHIIATDRLLKELLGELLGEINFSDEYGPMNPEIVRKYSVKTLRDYGYINDLINRTSGERFERKARELLERFYRSKGFSSMPDYIDLDILPIPHVEVVSPDGRRTEDSSERKRLAKLPRSSRENAFSSLTSRSTLEAVRARYGENLTDRKIELKYAWWWEMPRMFALLPEFCCMLGGYIFNSQISKGHRTENSFESYDGLGKWVNDHDGDPAMIKKGTAFVLGSTLLGGAAGGYFIAPRLIDILLNVPSLHAVLALSIVLVVAIVLPMVIANGVSHFYWNLKHPDASLTLVNKPVEQTAETGAAEAVTTRVATRKQRIMEYASTFTAHAVGLSLVLPMVLGVDTPARQIAALLVSAGSVTFSFGMWQKIRLDAAPYSLGQGDSLACSISDNITFVPAVKPRLAFKVVKGKLGRPVLLARQSDEVVRLPFRTAANNAWEITIGGMTVRVTSRDEVRIVNEKYPQVIRIDTYGWSTLDKQSSSSAEDEIDAASEAGAGIPGAETRKAVRKAAMTEMKTAQGDGFESVRAEMSWMLEAFFDKQPKLEKLQDYASAIGWAEDKMHNALMYDRGREVPWWTRQQAINSAVRMFGLDQYDRQLIEAAVLEIESGTDDWQNRTELFQRALTAGFEELIGGQSAMAAYELAQKDATTVASKEIIPAMSRMLRVFFGGQPEMEKLEQYAKAVDTAVAAMYGRAQNMSPDQALDLVDWKALDLGARDRKIVEAILGEFLKGRVRNAWSSAAFAFHHALRAAQNEYVRQRQTQDEVNNESSLTLRENEGRVARFKRGLYHAAFAGALEEAGKRAGNRYFVSEFARPDTFMEAYFKGLKNLRAFRREAGDRDLRSYLESHEKTADTGTSREMRSALAALYMSDTLRQMSILDRVSFWFYYRIFVEAAAGVYVGVLECLRVFNFVKFYRGHSPAGVPAWKDIRTYGIAAIWAGMIGAALWAFFGLGGHEALGVGMVIKTIAAGLAGNILTHAVYNTIFVDNPLTLGKSIRISEIERCVEEMEDKQALSEQDYSRIDQLIIEPLIDVFRTENIATSINEDTWIAYQHYKGVDEYEEKPFTWNESKVNKLTLAILIAADRIHQKSSSLFIGKLMGDEKKRAVLFRLAAETHNSFFRNEIATMLDKGSVLIAELDFLTPEDVDTYLVTGQGEDGKPTKGEKFKNRRNNPKWKEKLTLADVREGKRVEFLKKLIAHQLSVVRNDEHGWYETSAGPAMKQKMISKYEELLKQFADLSEKDIMATGFAKIKMNTVAQPWEVLRTEARLYQGPDGQKITEDRLAYLFSLQKTNVVSNVMIMSISRLFRDTGSSTMDNLALRAVNAFWRVNSPWNNYSPKDNLISKAFDLKTGEDYLGIDEINKDDIVLKAIVSGLGLTWLNEAVAKETVDRSGPRALGWLNYQIKQIIAEYGIVPNEENVKAVGSLLGITIADYPIIADREHTVVLKANLAPKKEDEYYSVAQGIAEKVKVVDRYVPSLSNWNDLDRTIKGGLVSAGLPETRENILKVRQYLDIRSSGGIGERRVIVTINENETLDDILAVLHSEGKSIPGPRVAINSNAKATSETAKPDQDILDKALFGFDIIEIYKEILKDPEVFGLMKDILSRTYAKFLNEDGARFVEEYFNTLSALVPRAERNELTTDELKATFLRLRARFQEMGLPKLYNGEYRQNSLRRSIELAGADAFQGYVIDLGADDNRLGKELLSLYPDRVKYVLGIDIEKRDSVNEIPGKLGFRVQDLNVRTLPVEDGTADTVVVRYALHHMPWEQQESFLREIRRILKPGGRLVIYEDTYSVQMTPLIADEHGLQKQLEAIQDPRRLRLLLAGLDTFSHGIKDKHQPFPSTYRTVEGWRELLEKTGFSVPVSNYYGIPIQSLNQAPLGIFVAVREADGMERIRTSEGRHYDVEENRKALRDIGIAALKSAALCILGIMLFNEPQLNSGVARALILAAGTLAGLNGIAVTASLKYAIIKFRAASKVHDLAPSLIEGIDDQAFDTIAEVIRDLVPGAEVVLGESTEVSSVFATTSGKRVTIERWIVAGNGPIPFKVVRDAFLADLIAHEVGRLKGYGPLKTYIYGWFFVRPLVRKALEQLQLWQEFREYIRVNEETLDTTPPATYTVEEVLRLYFPPYRIDPYALALINSAVVAGEISKHDIRMVLDAEPAFGKTLNEEKARELIKKVQETVKRNEDELRARLEKLVVITSSIQGVIHLAMRLLWSSELLLQVVGNHPERVDKFLIAVNDVRKAVKERDAGLSDDDIYEMIIGYVDGIDPRTKEEMLDYRVLPEDIIRRIPENLSSPEREHSLRDDLLSTLKNLQQKGEMVKFLWLLPGGKQVHGQGRIVSFDDSNVNVRADNDQQLIIPLGTLLKIERMNGEVLWNPAAAIADSVAARIGQIISGESGRKRLALPARSIDDLIENWWYLSGNIEITWERNGETVMRRGTVENLPNSFVLQDQHRVFNNIPHDKIIKIVKDGRVLWQRPDSGSGQNEVLETVKEAVADTQPAAFLSGKFTQRLTRSEREARSKEIDGLVIEAIEEEADLPGALSRAARRSVRGTDNMLIVPFAVPGAVELTGRVGGSRAVRAYAGVAQAENGEEVLIISLPESGGNFAGDMADAIARIQEDGAWLDKVKPGYASTNAAILAVSRNVYDSIPANSLNGVLSGMGCIIKQSAPLNKAEDILLLSRVYDFQDIETMTDDAVMNLMREACADRVCDGVSRRQNIVVSIDIEAFPSKKTDRRLLVEMLRDSNVSVRLRGGTRREQEPVRALMKGQGIRVLSDAQGADLMELSRDILERLAQGFEGCELDISGYGMLDRGRVIELLNTLGKAARDAEITVVLPENLQGAADRTAILNGIATGSVSLVNARTLDTAAAETTLEGDYVKLTLSTRAKQGILISLKDFLANVRQIKAVEIPLTDLAEEEGAAEVINLKACSGNITSLAGIIAESPQTLYARFDNYRDEDIPSLDDFHEVMQLAITEGIEQFLVEDLDAVARGLGRAKGSQAAQDFLARVNTFAGKVLSSRDRKDGTVRKKMASLARAVEKEGTPESAVKLLAFVKGIGERSLLKAPMAGKNGFELKENERDYRKGLLRAYAAALGYQQRYLLNDDAQLPGDMKLSEIVELFGCLIRFGETVSGKVFGPLQNKCNATLEILEKEGAAKGLYDDDIRAMLDYVWMFSLSGGPGSVKNDMLVPLLGRLQIIDDRTGIITGKDSQLQYAYYLAMKSLDVSDFRDKARELEEKWRAEPLRDIDSFRDMRDARAYVQALQTGLITGDIGTEDVDALTQKALTAVDKVTGPFFFTQKLKILDLLNNRRQPVMIDEELMPVMKIQSYLHMLGAA